jgi:hypothetical protein
MRGKERSNNPIRSVQISLAQNGNSSTIFEDDTNIVVNKIIEPQREPGNVAIHEAAHTAVATLEGVGVTEVNNIPSGDAFGITRPVRLTAASAAAPYALGLSGTGYDMYLVEHFLNTDRRVAASAARSLLAGNEDLLIEIASRIEDKRRIGQFDVNEAKAKVEKRRKGIFPVEVITITNSGEIFRNKTESDHEEVVVDLKNVIENDYENDPELELDELRVKLLDEVDEVNYSDESTRYAWMGDEQVEMRIIEGKYFINTQDGLEELVEVDVSGDDNVNNT